MPLSKNSNVFSGNPLNRASERRGDAAWLEALQAGPDSLCLPLWNGQPFTEKTADGKIQLAYVPGGMANELAGGWERLLFMGLWKDTAVFAVDMEGAPDPADGPLSGLGKFADLRQVAMALPGSEAAIAATAKGMFEWRRKHRFCASCGEPSQVSDGGWKRVCPACRTEHFPRTDPVVIMLAVKGDKCLVGRQAMWPAGMFSALAGFLEPGESIEEACARELKEEAGLNAVAVRYHSTQPWPYPNSLMIGLIAEVDSEDAAPDQTELEAVRWFAREEARQLINGGFDGCFAPPPLAIAHQLIKSWAEEG
ncbi:NAD(+) diphosphatase [Caulobacter mirabilis]|uniref:NAD(+) diphosphatase n=1 Tax=Caulobacter mirabilis TaxID=69666 RepID=A0A2D2B4G5_9CAUL|nr:NAD(+) diphosphatase [Caulobacter mirabilis]ATQ45118.1 NAD(+) diphosphatase [Caulobacter mirabilis]